MNAQTKTKSGVLNTLSALIDRVRFFNRAGFQFDGKRDLYEVFGYKQRLEPVDFYTKYIRQDVASRVVDAPVDATWRDHPVIEGNDALNAAWEDLLSKDALQLWSKIQRSDKLAGMGRYSILLLGYSDGSNLAAPVNVGKKRELVYAQPYSEVNATVTKLEGDKSSPRYGLPTEYTLQTFDPASLQPGQDIMSQFLRQGQGSTNALSINAVKVHHSRVVHIVENPLDNEVFGIPRFQQVYNILDDLEKVRGGSAETFWLIANRGIAANIDKEMELSPKDAEDLSEELDEYMHQLRRVIRTRGVEVKSLGSESPDPSGTFKVLMALLSGTTGIPQRVLMGSEAGQLAAEQDRANWATRIDERRRNFAETTILKPLMTSLFTAGVLPELGKAVFKWPSAFQLTPKEQGEMQAQRARAVVNIARQGEKGAPVTSQEEAREMVGLPRKMPEGDTPIAPPPEPAKPAVPFGGAPGDGSSNRSDQ